MTYIPLSWALYGAIVLIAISFTTGFFLGVRCRTCRNIRKNGLAPSITRINSVVPPQKKEE